ncbi:putative SEC14 cytosolic factor [Glarea lozoyensis 74030]|uniref:Putative SEC14 cytosolic factor n=1 Tax=Glarea lozoyensis (strain ATCC 74030 / MF5533) TaxID=1104152 RepID=H0EMN7_GLAL7|nr:putative SEC14 cytosolic factor [Glarea lozoyensis 74030]
MSTSGPAHRVESAAVEYGYPQGHLGHLSGEEEEAFRNFKAYCQEKGYFTPREGGKEASHDDPTLLYGSFSCIMTRFLRARRFVVADAYKQFQETEDWRKANEIDKLYETIDLEQYEETRRLYPQWTGRRDRRGIPVYVFEVKHLNSKTMSAYEKSASTTKSQAKTDGKISPKLLRLFALYENLIRFTMPLCTALTDRDHPRTPITQTHYPETLDRIFIIGAPAFFPTVWGWIKKWFDPITTSKIFIIAHADVKKTLESFIDPVNIPKKYGGQLDFEFGHQPVLDPHLNSVCQWEGKHTNFPEGPIHWEHVGEDKIKAVARGTLPGSHAQRNEEVCTVTRKLPDEPQPVESQPIRPDMLSAPTETEIPTTSVPATETAAPVAAPTTETSAPAPVAPVAVAKDEVSEGTAVEAGQIVSDSRPAPQTFVTASEGLPKVGDLSISEKVPETGNHSTRAGALLDPTLKN